MTPPRCAITPTTPYEHSAEERAACLSAAAECLHQLSAVDPQNSAEWMLPNLRLIDGVVTVVQVDSTPWMRPHHLGAGAEPASLAFLFDQLKYYNAGRFGQ